MVECKDYLSRIVTVTIHRRGGHQIDNIGSRGGTIEIDN